MNGKTWESVVEYIEERMKKIRHAGKFDKGNEELWRLKKAMQEIDPTIEGVGENFAEYENEIYGGNK